MPNKRRRLTDLYVLGKPFEVKDDQGENGVEVWLQKLNPLEKETSRRRAGAERAKMLAHLEDRDSDFYQSTVNDVIDYYGDRESLVRLAIRSDLAKAQSRIEAETAANEKWSEDGYLGGLLDAWQEELSRRHAEDPDDEEANRVLDKLKEFDDEVEKQVTAERERLEKDHAKTSLPKLRDLAVEKMVEANAVNAFIMEFETQRLLFAVRDPDDHDEYYFESRDEVLALDDRVRDQLSNAYTELEVDAQEGKGSRAEDTSSPSPEAPESQETETDSGPEDAPPSKKSQRTSSKRSSKQTESSIGRST